MIKCGKCGKENQDHYKFCLGCGSELPKNAPKEFQAEPSKAPPARSMPPAQTSVVPPAATPAVTPSEAAPAPQQPAPQQPAPQPPISAAPGSAVASAPCPQCGHANPATNRFCAACGYKLGGASGLQASVAPPAVQPVAAASGVTLVALRADGSEAGRYALPAGATATVGRDTGTIFAGDSYLSPRHATFSLGAGTVSVRDEGSLNGVYIKLQPNVPFHLEPGSVFRIGQEIVRFEALASQPPVDGVERFGSPARGIIGRLALVIGRDSTGNAFPVPERGVYLGRERGDILFGEDGYVSGLHCRVAPAADGHVYLTDVGSSNGTFVRVRDNHPLASGDILLMGQQVFRVEF